MKPISDPSALLKAGAGLALVTVLGLTACAPDDVAEFSDDEPTEAAAVEEASAEEKPEEESTEEPEEPSEDQDVIYAEVDDPITFEVCEDAEANEDATVTWLEDEVYPEEEIAAAVEADTVEFGDEQIEIPGVPAIVVPERVGQAGCLIEYDAPGRCLPAVEISDSCIPGYQVPGREIPEIELPDGSTRPALTQGELSQPEKSASGSRAEENCQPDEEELTGGDVVGPVARGPIARGPISQGPTSQGPQSNGPVTSEGDSFSGYSLSGYSVTGMSVSGVSISGDSLSGYMLEDTEGTDRAERDETVYYTTEGDVLFDSSEYELRSDAESELQAIADDIAERDDDFEITVEGHTDNVPVDPDQDFADNDELSELRAESVAQWLIGNAGVDEGAITSEGLGEDYPRADNDTDEGRQQNRRVVITVIPEDAESSIDYELEGSEG